MKYRKLGSLDFDVSALGFGAMRLPTVGGDSNAVDEQEARRIVRFAIDQGVNYVDTAYPYHGGKGEAVLGRILRDGYRERVKLATKFPTWALKERADFDRLLDEQMARLGVDFIDVYLLHNLQAPFWAPARDLGVRDWLDRIRADGRVGHVGFSFHDNLDLFKEIVDAYDSWDVCQIQYNYVNECVQAGMEGLKYAADKGLGVIVMEPLLGGCLADPPPGVRNALAQADTARTPVDWALQWLWNQPEVSVVLSGMSTMTQTEQNICSACASGVGSLTEQDLAVLEQARAHYAELSVVPCTRCGYCMPCPTEIDIPKMLQLYNDALIFGGNHTQLNGNIYRCVPEPKRAGACVACGKCEEKCPQRVAITEWLPKVAELFSN